MSDQFENRLIDNHIILLHRLSKILAICIITLGFVVVFGWISGNLTIKSVIPGFATMKLNTSLLFILLGFSLLFLDTEEKFASLCAGIAVLIALMTLAEYSFGWNLGIDELLIKDTQTLTGLGSFAGRMSVITAVNFCLLGVGLVSLKQRQFFSQVLTLFSLTLTLIALIGYIYNAQSLGTILPYSTLALNTTIAFITLGAGILFLQTDTELLKIVFSNNNSGVVVRALLPVSFLLPVILGWLRLQGQNLNLYTEGFGSAVTSILNVVILLASIAWLVRYLNQAEQRRLVAEAVVMQVQSELEQRVIDRTTELAEANKTLQASEARFAGLLNTAHDAVVSTDEELRILLFNQGAERIFGYQIDELIGKPLNTLLPQRFQENHNQYMAGFGASNTKARIMAPDRLEVRGIRKNGEEFPADVSISTLLIDGKRFYTGVVRDITKQAEATTALKASEQRFRLLVNSVLDYAIYMLDPKGNIVSWNEGAERIKGYSTEEILGQNFSRFFTEGDIKQGEPQRLLETAAQDGYVISEGWRVRKDSSLFWARVVMTALHDDAGNLIGYSKITRDLTETREAEKLVRENEELLRQVLEILPVGVWLTDSKGNIIQANMAGEKIWAGAKYVGIDAYGEYKGWWVATGKRIESDEWAAARAINGETSINEEVQIECFDGSYKYILNSAIPIRDDKDKIVGSIIVNQDVTSIKEAEIRLQKYASALERSNKDLESFAYTASHDLQEPLRKIQAFGDRLNSHYSDTLDEQGVDYLRRMISASNRMTILIHDLLDYSRLATKKTSVKAIDLNTVIKAVCSDLEVAIENSKAQIKYNDLETIEADRTQMRQLFQNLISNAIKFSVPDQIPVIRIHGRLIDEAVTSRDKQPQQLYELVISDNGIGFDNKYASRIMGIFQRLHARTAYEGTGIGLAICQKIVEGHGGKLEAQGIVGQGATFRIILPVQQGE